MSKNKEKTITLSELLDVEIISTRKSVEVIDFELKKIIDDNREINIDFSNISQISRSFADEILKLRKNYRLQNISLNFVNTNNFILRMIDLVSHKATTITPVASVNVAASIILDLNSL